MTTDNIAMLVLLFSLVISLAWGFWQRSRARSAESIMYRQNEIIEYQNKLLKKL